MLTIVDLAHGDIAGHSIDVNFGILGWYFSPARIRALGRDKIRQLREGIEQSNGGVSGEIRRKETEVKIGTCKDRAFQRAAKLLFIRTTPVHAMMQQCRRRMELS